MEKHRELVHKSDVEISLHVLDDLSGFSNPNIRCLMNPRLYDQPVDSGQQFPRLTILAGDDLFHIFQSVLGIAGVDPFRGVADLEIDAGLQS